MACAVANGCGGASSKGAVEITSRSWSIFGSTDQRSAPPDGRLATCGPAPGLPQPTTLLVAWIGVANAAPNDSFTLSATATDGLKILRPLHPLVERFVLRRRPVKLGIIVVGRPETAAPRGTVTAELTSGGQRLTSFAITLVPKGRC
jgi:hypothetical protein